VGAGILLSSASVSESIDSLSRSLSHSSLSLLPKEESEEEYGIKPEKNSTQHHPKPQEFWTLSESQFVKDSVLVSKEYFSVGSLANREEWNRDLQRLGRKGGHLVSDHYGLALVAIGISLRSLNTSEEQFQEIVNGLRETNIYGRNALIYGFRLPPL